MGVVYIRGGDQNKMSILISPFERSNEKPGHDTGGDKDELFLFGYQCKTYRDDEKAMLEDAGAYLIPWMGDTSLMVDR